MVASVEAAAGGRNRIGVVLAEPDRCRITVRAAEPPKIEKHGFKYRQRRAVPEKRIEILKVSVFQKNFSNTRMDVKVNFEEYCGAAIVERHKLTEPNQALQRMNVLVTYRVPSSTLCGKPLRR